MGRHAWFRGESKHRLELTDEQIAALTAVQDVDVWRRAICMHIAMELPASKLNDLEAAFRALDVANEGFITRQDLIRHLTVRGVSQLVAERAAEHADVDGSGSIEWSEFCAAVLPSCHELFAGMLLSAFQSFDSDMD